MTQTRTATKSMTTTSAPRPRLGFLGVGWIGRARLEALAHSGEGEVAALVDPSPQALASARELAPDAACAASLEALGDLALDGLVIATPSALHAAPAIRALERGLAVFCQKPLGRNAAETRAVIDAARRADRLLAVDLSYRRVRAAEVVRELVQSGDLGRIHAAELCFHNAYGPDKSWFYDRELAGGGCVTDLGIHLVDLALWTLGFPRVESVTSRLLCRGRPLAKDSREVEDFATARLDLAGGATLQLACSWNLPAGRDAVIFARFYGAQGGAAFRNVGGSFYDFVAERYERTQRIVLFDRPDAWGGRTLIDWTRALAAGARFDAEIANLIGVAQALDAVCDNAM